MDLFKFLEPITWSGLSVKEEIENNFVNMEAGPSRIVVKEEIETDVTMGKTIVCLQINNV